MDGDGHINSAPDIQRRIQNELESSRREYEAQLKAALEDPRTNDGESQYESARSGLEGRDGYFEPKERNSFYEIDNPWDSNDEETYPVDVIQTRVAEDKKKWNVVFLDLMGAGAGAGLADHVFSANLIHIDSSVDHTHLSGDCLSEEGWLRIKESITDYIFVHQDTERPAVLHTVFWRPIRAMVYFRNNLYALQRMYTILRDIYEMQPVGGRIYFQAPSEEWLNLFESNLVRIGAQNILRRHPTGSLMFRLVKSDAVQILPAMDSSEDKQQLLSLCKRHGAKIAA